MKKFLALLLAFAMTLALVACGEKKDDAKTDGDADGEKTYSCLVCKAAMTEPVKYSASIEGDKVEKSSVDPDKDMSTDLKENHEKDTEQTSPAENERVSFPWWTVAVIAAAVIGVGILATALFRKNSSDSEKR